MSTHWSDEEREQRALDYLAGEMDDATRREFARALSEDAELRMLVSQLEETMGALVLAAPVQPLPPGLRERVLAGPRAQSIIPFPPWVQNWLPWSLAAGLTIGCFFLTARLRQERLDLASARAAVVTGEAARDEARAALAAARAESEKALEQQRSLARETKNLVAQNDALRRTVEAFRGRDSLAQVRIATLSAKVGSLAQAGVTIVWDQERQRGMLQITNLPELGPGQDYQLWVIDPKYRIPVNGGIIRTTNRAGAGSRVYFAPELKVEHIDRFAITIERTGGVPKAQGPLVFAGS